MKNYAAFILSVATLIGMGLGFSSCKEDEPPVKPKLSFAETTMSVTEAAGVIEVELRLDKAHSKNLRIEFNLGGTASDQHDVGTASADYQVVGDHDAVEIPAGQTSASIELEIFSDGAFEADETIEVSIVDANTSDVEITADDEVVITITNDDVQATVAFASTALTVNEADGTAEEYLTVAVQLDNPAPSDVTITYTLEESTALDSLLGFAEELPSQFYDYYIHGVSGELVIPAGETSGNIEIQLLSDFNFEGDETIVITLTGATSAAIGTNDTMTITIEQEDGKVIGLVWDPAYTDVDMDLFMWIGPTVDELQGPWVGSYNAATNPREEVLIFPKTIADGITEAAFGLSYNFYEGSPDPMNFEAHFIDFVDGSFEPAESREVYAASYTQANLNPWFTTKVDPAIVQTFRIVEGAYVDFTDITVPANGSRRKTTNFLEKVLRSKGTINHSPRLP